MFTIKRKGMCVLSGKFPIGCFESVIISDIRDTEPFLSICFYDYNSNPEIYFVLEEFCSAIKSKSDLTVLQGNLLIECYFNDKKIKHSKYSKVKMIEISCCELDHSSSSPIVLDVKWEYEGKIDLENI